MIFEERRAIIQRDRVNEFVADCRASLWPSIRASGGEVVCLLSGLIGDPQNEFVQITKWRSFLEWEKTQTTARAGLPA